MQSVWMLTGWRVKINFTVLSSGAFQFEVLNLQSGNAEVHLWQQTVLDPVNYRVPMGKSGVLHDSQALESCERNV